APLTPTDWELTFDGESITLSPSIGNWSFPCRSHYWIRNNRAEWALSMSQEEIDVGRAADLVAKQKWYGVARKVEKTETKVTPPNTNWWQKIVGWFNAKGE